jgi:hypothetical protein
MLYLWAATPRGSEVLGGRLSDSTIVAALKVLGPDTLMMFVRRQVVSDDPDLRPAADGTPRHYFADGMIQFILNNAVDLLRASDADAVLLESQRELPHGVPVPWIAATARLRGLVDMNGATNWLKNEITTIPITRRLDIRQDHQAMLAATLWHMRGPAEKDYLTQWFYSVQPMAQQDIPNGSATFVRMIGQYERQDVDSILTSIVSDPRFDRSDSFTLAELLKTVNSRRGTPLVEPGVISDYRYASLRFERPDQTQVLANWRALLREHFRR